MYLLEYFVLLLIFNCVKNEKIWHSNVLDIPRKINEDFILENVWVDENLSGNFTANFWKSINVRHSSYAVGVSNDEILLLKITEGSASHDLSIDSKLKSIDKHYTDAGFLETWNKTSRKNDISLLTTSSEGILQLFDIGTLDELWTSNLENPVDSMKIILNPILRKNQIFMATKNHIIIYNFNISGPQLWLSETLEFENPVRSFETATYRDAFFLFVPQKSAGKLRIFKYKNDHFDSFKDLNAAGVEQVVVFHENFKTFFAVNGIDAAIYQFNKKNLILKEKIPNVHLGGISFWLPVTLNNIQQTLILFAQRSLEHGTHKSFFTEIFTYKNDNFEKHEDIPCQIFGEKFNTQVCLTNFEKSVGLAGASYVSIGDNLGLVLARNSRIFRIGFKSRMPKNPIQVEVEMLNATRNKLQEILDEKLKNDVDTVDVPLKIMAKKPVAGSRTSASRIESNSHVFRGRSGANFSEEVQEMMVKLLELKGKMDDIEQAEKSGKFGRLIVKGVATIENMSAKKVSSKTLNNEDTGHILSDFVRKNTPQVIEATKTFADLTVENLSFESIDGVDASNILFEDPELLINGDVTFRNPVAVLNNIETENINDFSSSSIINMNQKIPGVLLFENINVDDLNTETINERPLSTTLGRNSEAMETMRFPENVTVKNINGIDFEEFLKQLCLVNIPTHFTSSINIDGDLIVDDLATTQFLNTIKFPANYLFLDGSGGVSITGQKNFLDTLEGLEIRTNGQYINGIRTSDIFTLSTQQDITRTTFANLEVTNTLKHEGKTIGEQVSKFLPNPTLLETNIIKSNVNFEELEVTGSVTIDEHFNDINFQEILEDIVYKDVDFPNINSIKEFPEGLTIRNNMNITSNSINLIPLDHFVTKDTNQVLNIAQLTGNVSVESMEINQLINGINITKLDQETVKITGEQFISSFLIFKNDLEANSLEIQEILNEEPVENFVPINGDIVLNEGITFDDLRAENLLINGNFNGRIEEIDMENFVKNRMSYSGDQEIAENFNVEKSHINVVNCDVNSVNCGSIFDKKNSVRKLMDRISNGKMRVKDLLVNGELNIEHLNGITLKEIRELKEKSIIINGDVNFLNLRINKLSDVSFDDMINNVVSKNETSFTISGTKIFKQGFVVDKLIETEMLNSIPIESLLTKEGKQIILSPLEIHGNVTFGADVEIGKTLNGVFIHDIKEYFEMIDDVYVIKGDILFDRLARIYNLEINGNLNDKDVENVLTNMANNTADLTFFEHFHFKNTVSIDGDLLIENHINDIDLSERNENVVYLNKTLDNRVESSVTFISTDTLAHNLFIETDLITKKLTGIDLDDLANNAVFLNKGYLPGFYHFENLKIHEKLLTKYVNEVCMNHTIRLVSNQEIHELSCENVAFLNDVPVGKYVNKRSMSEEYANTVLSGTEQEIFSELRFTNNTLIRKSLEVAGLWNGKPLNKMVTTDTNQNLTASYSFPTKINVNSNMYVNGFVNSIDMALWEIGGMKIVSKDTQVIEAPWHVGGNLTFKDVLNGDNFIYEFDIQKDIEIIRNRNETKNSMVEQYELDHTNICKDISIFEDKLEEQIYKFEMLEDVFLLNYPRNIGTSYFFTGNKPILLLNGVDSCNTDFFAFENDIFHRISDINSGEIEQMVSTSDGDSTFFITKSRPGSTCQVQGTNVWKFTRGVVEILQNIENQQQLQESLVPLTFYGLNKYGVTEFRIDPKMAVAVYVYRKWKIHEENAAFVPRGLGTGLALRTGNKLIKLRRDDPIDENEIGFDGTSLRGDVKEMENSVLPGGNNNKLIVLRVGPESLNKTLLAVVFHERTVVGRNFDVLKIFEDYNDSKIFQKILTFNPTALSTLNFHNGETLLLILENEEKLQVYHYRGIEGFKHRFSADVQGSRMFKMSLPLNSEEPVEVIGVVNRNTVRIIRPVMIGNRMNERLKC